MSRSEPGSSGGSVPGTEALPSPKGDADAIRASAASVGRVVARAEATATVRGTLAPALASVWSGQAAATAQREATELSRRASAVLRDAGDVTTPLLRYAAALANAVTTVRGLQRQWDQAQSNHDLSVARDRLVHAANPALPMMLARHQDDLGTALGRLARLHQGAMAELTSAEAVAAAAIERLDPRFRGPTPTVGSVRAQMIDGLTFAEGARDYAALEISAKQAAAELPPGSTMTPEQYRDWRAKYAGKLDDPRFAAALVNALGPERIGSSAAELQDNTSSNAISLARQWHADMGTVMVAVSRAGTTGSLDAASQAGLSRDAQDATRVYSTLARGSYEAAPLPDDNRPGSVTGTWVIGQFMTTLNSRPAGPGSRLGTEFLKVIGKDMVEADLVESTTDTRRTTLGSNAPRSRDEIFDSWFDDPARSGDALAQLLHQLAGNPEAARTVLVATISDAHGRRTTVIRALVNRPDTVARYAGVQVPSDGTPLAVFSALNGVLEKAIAGRNDSASIRIREGLSDQTAEDQNIAELAMDLERFAKQTQPLHPSLVSALSDSPAAVDGALLPSCVPPPAGSLTGQMRLSRDTLRRLVITVSTPTPDAPDVVPIPAELDRLARAELARATDPKAPLADKLAADKRLGYFVVESRAVLVNRATVLASSNDRALYALTWPLDKAQEKNLVLDLAPHLADALRTALASDAAYEQAEIVQRWEGSLSSHISRAAEATSRLSAYSEGASFAVSAPSLATLKAERDARWAQFWQEYRESLTPEGLMTDAAKDAAKGTAKRLLNGEADELPGDVRRILTTVRTTMG